MNVKDVFNNIKSEIQQKIFSSKNLDVNSCGTKQLELDTSKYEINDNCGYWTNPQNLSSKPPRWIVQVDNNQAQFSLDPQGNEYSINKTLGFINNRSGKSSACIFRVLFAVKGPSAWNLEQSPWEALLILGFDKPFEAGTSGDPVSSFNPQDKSVIVGGGNGKKYNYQFCAILKVPQSQTVINNQSYDKACESLAVLCNGKCYDSTDTSDLVNDLSQIFIKTKKRKFEFLPIPTLIGIDDSIYQQINAALNSGKKNIIFYGPPGTGKTTLAELLAAEVGEQINNNREYTMLTASSAWSSQDLIGGYQPLGHGMIGFIEGVLLRNFDKPIVIDELNRCPIDKVIGPLFSVLSGQKTVLPYRVDASDINSDFHTILPEDYINRAANEHAPSEAWRLICTLNTYDKNQLGQISYALSRRFAWIHIPEPSDLNDFVLKMASKIGFTRFQNTEIAPVAQMWQAINDNRAIGGAPIIDFLKILYEFDSTFDITNTPNKDSIDTYIHCFGLCVLPLLDGLTTRELTQIIDRLSLSWKVANSDYEEKFNRLKKMCLEFCG